MRVVSQLQSYSESSVTGTKTWGKRGQITKVLGERHHMYKQVGRYLRYKGIAIVVSQVQCCGKKSKLEYTVGEESELEYVCGERPKIECMWDESDLEYVWRKDLN